MNLEEKSAVAAAALGAVASTIGAIANIKSKQSQEAIAATDREIAAEKKRDGKSKESLAKIFVRSENNSKLISLAKVRLFSKNKLLKA